ncbi:protein FAR1-RELATED SEQUENCE 5-like isoform X2 [Vicia villosa]|uniref:protein FAR1-RELATED SEQUENCE 5-like isoform X2 n=1 Tax=Vicia villosa TaxID=3911 RepID=UPI00273BD26A|nr:protein FAR1-RELATED SEQUENCE 5-like isoform X2 [Vicia villosa]
MDNGEDADDVGRNNGSYVDNEEGKEDLDDYKDIGEISDDDIRDMKFESEKKACEFYETYAEYHGFAVRRDEIDRDFKKNIIMRQLVCNREGKRHKKHMLRVDRHRGPRPITRTGCLARLRVAYDVVTRSWRVVAFESAHNHKLTPQRFVHFIPKYRRLSEADKALVDGLHTCGVRTCHILGFMLGQKGGHEDLGFIKKDLYNYFSNGAKAKRENGDAFAALSYLQAKADNDPMFFSKFTTTEDGRLQNLFWSDGTSRFDFECFGDVVAFDTTYKKNRYNKPFVIFCGYNHHGETTIFGCALISDEKTETYKWVLNAFSEAMFHKCPNVFVTDGDGAMREAIRVEFPNASHRLCLWHLHQNAIENVKNSKFLEEFKSLIYANYTPETFEDVWKRIIDDNGLSENKWVKKTYEIKKMWSSAYMRDTLFCGIRTTSMCEGINSFIQGYVDNKNSLVDFMHNFERALKEYRHNELLSDFKSFYYEPVLTSALEGIETGASEIFTCKKFRDVKNEIEGAAALNIIDRIEIGNNVTLKMNRFCNPNSEFSVSLEKTETVFLCDCRLFERLGIPCSHIICAMRHEHMNMFPKSLICKRWTKSAKDDHIASVFSEESDSEKLFMFRRGAMSAAFNTLCDVSCKDSGSYKEALEGVYKLCENIKKRHEVNDKRKSNPSVIGDPVEAKTKGAPHKKKKLWKTKGAIRKEKKSWKSRQCSHCKLPDHTKRKCPVLAARDDLHQVDDKVSSDQSIDESMNFNGVDNARGSKQKGKGVNVAFSTQDSINKITSKQVEKEKSSGPKVNMADTNGQTRPTNVMGHDSPIKMESFNATWHNGVGYGTHYNGVSNQSVSIFPQFVPNQGALVRPQFIPNQSSLIFPQFVPNQRASIFPQFPLVDNFTSHSNSLLYNRSHNIPHSTHFMGTLKEMEHSAKFTRNKGENEDSKPTNRNR